MQKPPINNSYKSSLNKPNLGTFKDNKIRSSTSEPFVAYGNESMTSVVLCNYIMSYLMHYAKDYLKIFKSYKHSYFNKSNRIITL